MKNIGRHNSDAKWMYNFFFQFSWRPREMSELRCPTYDHCYRNGSSKTEWKLSSTKHSYRLTATIIRPSPSFGSILYKQTFSMSQRYCRAYFNTFASLKYQLHGNTGASLLLRIETTLTRNYDHRNRATTTIFVTLFVHSFQHIFWVVELSTAESCTKTKGDSALGENYRHHFTVKHLQISSPVVQLLSWRVTVSDTYKTMHEATYWHSNFTCRNAWQHQADLQPVCGYQFRCDAIRLSLGSL
jgi:hypothetical protein